MGDRSLTQVVDNPRFGVVHHLRTLSLHALVIYLGLLLAQLGWGEFVEWGKGPLGQILLTAPTSLSSMGCDHDGDEFYGDGGNEECGGVGGADFGVPSMPMPMSSWTDTERFVLVVGVGVYVLV